MTKITKGRTDEIIAMLGNGLSLAAACQEVGISRAGLYRRMGSDKELESAVYAAKAQAAERELEDLNSMYLDALEGRKRYDPHLLKEYGHHIRWKSKVFMPERYGEQKNRTGVEVSDGTIRIMWEND